MDFLKTLKLDHELVEELFDALEAADADSLEEREALFKKLRTELFSHSKAEEAVLYTRLEELEEVKSLALESTEEHDVIDYMLSKLEATPVEDTGHWEAEIKVLKEAVEHHVQEEETRMFPRVRELFTAKDLDQMAVRFKEEKEMFKRLKNEFSEESLVVMTAKLHEDMETLPHPQRGKRKKAGDKRSAHK